MSYSDKKVLVFGATGQQGGSVVSSLLKAGWQVRALVRDPMAQKALALRASGVEVVQGDFADNESIRSAMKGIYGVFSVQPSSPGGGISDEEEVRFGIAIADLALETGVRHLVYSSGGAVGGKLTGMGHFDSKAHIEAHIAALLITSTVIRPASFMEMLVMPGFGLEQGQFNFFVKREQPIQLLAVEDIGKFVAAIFADTQRFSGKTLDIASDVVTGQDLEALFSEAAGRPIHYSRFTDEVLAVHPFLQKLTELVDDGTLRGKADLDFCRSINPEIRSLRSWLAGTGRDAFMAALGTGGNWSYNNQQINNGQPLG